MGSRGSIPVMSLQQRMRISQENAGLNQEEIAKKIGIGRATYAKTEQGVRESRCGKLLAIAAITGVDSHWLEAGRCRKPARPD